MVLKAGYRKQVQEVDEITPLIMLFYVRRILPHQEILTLSIGGSSVKGNGVN